VPVRRGGIAVVLLAALLLTVDLAGCSPHPVGPARTYRSYEAKARTTAESALSAVETVRLAAQAGGEGKATGPFLGQVVSDQEDALSGVQGTFASIQPPDGRADELRSTLDDLLTAALAHVTDVRVAVRRGELSDLSDLAGPLASDAEHLRAFVEAHR
jgi:hypothetical protein